MLYVLFHQGDKGDRGTRGQPGSVGPVGPVGAKVLRHPRLVKINWKICLSRQSCVGLIYHQKYILFN